MLHLPSHPDVISLASGYGTFLLPTVAQEAATRIIQAGQLPLSEAAGLPTVREALAARFRQLGATRVQAENVVLTPGAKAALFALLHTVLRPGAADEVLLPTPNWFGFRELVAAAGGTLQTLPLAPEENYTLTPERLRAALTPRTRVLLLSNPNNPTGRVYHEAELRALLAVTHDYPDLYVLSDEIYNLITFGERPTPSLLEFPDPHGRHLVVNGFSKSLALIGWNVGYLVAPPEVARACAAWQHTTGAAVAVPVQHAALAVTRDADAVAGSLVNQLHAPRRQMLAHLAALPQVPTPEPEATYYVFPDLRAYLSADLPLEAAAAQLVARLRAAGLEVVDGTTCGAPGFVRMSYAVPEAILREALVRLSQALHVLPPATVPAGFLDA